MKKTEKKKEKAPLTYNRILGFTILKVAFGVMFIFTGITMDMQSFFVSLVLGIALIAWGLLSYGNGKKELAAMEKKKVDSKRLVARKCPGCGAEFVGDECPYCGYKFY